MVVAIVSACLSGMASNVANALKIRLTVLVLLQVVAFLHLRHSYFRNIMIPSPERHCLFIPL